MNQKLQQAIQATRNGNNKKAQYLLTQTLQENPNDTQAWYLLSLLVDSEEKQITYLNRVVALDPSHEKAQEKLAALTTAVSATVILPPSPNDLNLEDQESGDLLPGWMADDTSDTFFETAVTHEADQQLPLKTISDEIPDWLSGSVVDEWAQAESETALYDEDEPNQLIEVFAEEPAMMIPEASPSPTTAPPKAPATKKEPAPKKKNQGSQLTLILAVLVLLAVLVGAFLIYLLITM